MTPREQVSAINSDSISLGARMDDCSVCGVWRLLGAAGTCVDCAIFRENDGTAALRVELAAGADPTKSDVVLRCHKCHGTMFWKRISENEFEVFPCCKTVAASEVKL